MSPGAYVPPILNAGSTMTTGSVAMSVVDSKIQTQLKSKEELRQQEQAMQTLWTVLSVTAASVAMVTAVVAMWWEASLITYLAMAFPLVTSPLVIRRTRKLNKLPTLKHEVNEVRTLVNDLVMENNQLTQSVDMLKERVEKLQGAEEAFADLVTSSGDDVIRMVDLSREHGTIQREMKQLEQTQRMQQVLQAFLRSDADHNFEMDDSELDMLMIRLKAIGGLSFLDESKMRDSLHNSDSKSLSSLYKVASGELEEDGYIEMT